MDAAPGLRHQERLLPTLNAVLMPATTARFHDSATAYAFTKPFFLFRPRPPPLSFASTRSPFLLPFSDSLCLGRSCAGCVYQAATFSSSNIQGFISLSTIALGCTTWFRDGSVLLVSLVLTKRNGGMEFFLGHLVDWEPYSDLYLRRGRDMRGWFCLFFHVTRRVLPLPEYLDQWFQRSGPVPFRPPLNSGCSRTATMVFEKRNMPCIHFILEA